MPVILNELLARLRVDYPNALAAFGSSIQAPKPDDYKLAPPEPLGDGYARNVLVGNDLDFETMGIRVHSGSSEFQFFIVEEKRRAGRTNILDYWTQVTALATALKPYQTCCVNDAGVNMWKLLEPQTVEGLPEEYAKSYHGVMLTYRATFQPGANGWPMNLAGSNL